MIGGARGKGGCEEVEEPGYRLSLPGDSLLRLLRFPWFPASICAGTTARADLHWGHPARGTSRPGNTFGARGIPPGPEKGELRTGIRDPPEPKGSCHGRGPGDDAGRSKANIDLLREPRAKRIWPPVAPVHNAFCLAKQLGWLPQSTLFPCGHRATPLAPVRRS